MKWFNPETIKPWLLLLPSVIVIGFLVGYGVWEAIAESFREWETGKWTVQYYEELLMKEAFWDSLFLSMYIAISSTLASLLIGLFLTRVLQRYFMNYRWKSLVWLPMLFPHFVAAYLIILFLSESGILSSLFYHFGWVNEIADFPFSIQSQHSAGIIFTYIWKEVPFVILMLLPIYQQFSPEEEATVRTLGGNSWDVFKTTEWPSLFPVLIETGIILFAFTLAAFEVPSVLGITYPKMLPVLSYQWFFENDWSNRPLAMAVMIITTLIILFIAFLSFWVTQRRRMHIARGR
ncbi:ABC transporter permease [Alteribacillus iranensis]|uniref:Putative spermidine/putrescine transport system permease protein n=1 Tax=Alteribacillus iranensis TaxID=930128 RepID=A0A1I2E967_9BACI|nr:ABC transporter permease subunit [Alteribacillus iranensis]SFE89233.1 putative spermidine/putrescine transport system permease protein [Alteribacillus iranensis]